MNNKKSQNKDGFFFLKRDPKQVRKLRNEILGIWAGICQEFGGKKDRELVRVRGQKCIGIGV